MKNDKEEIIITKDDIKSCDDHINKYIEEQMDYQDRVTSYINRKHELNYRKDYNPKIVKLYKSGLLVINKIEYKIEDFYIVIKNHNYGIICIDDRFKTNTTDYDKAVKFIDTTAFINLINNENTLVNENRIISNQDILLKVVNDWDGYLHSETKETDAIANKKIIN